MSEALDVGLTRVGDNGTAVEEILSVLERRPVRA
jgi:hypothetical protein